MNRKLILALSFWLLFFSNAYVITASAGQSTTNLIGASMLYSPTVQWLENVCTFVPWAPLTDLDLHAYTADNMHVGMNYDTGDYEVEIPGAVVSGDLRGGIEWIFVPSDIEVYFSVTGENLETLGEEGAEYQLAIMYYDENGNRYNSPLAIDKITAGEVINYRYEITRNPDGTYSVVVISDKAPPFPIWMVIVAGVIAVVAGVIGVKMLKRFLS